MTLVLPQTSTTATHGQLQACSGLVSTSASSAGRRLALTGEPTGGSVGIAVNTAANTRAIHLESDAVGETTWPSGTVTVRLNITGANTNVLWRSCHICRVNSEGVNQGPWGSETFATGVTLEEGVHTKNIAVSSVSASSTDRIYIVCGFARKEEATGLQELTWTTNQYIDTPIGGAGIAVSAIGATTGVGTVSITSTTPQTVSVGGETFTMLGTLKKTGGGFFEGSPDPTFSHGDGDFVINTTGATTKLEAYFTSNGLSHSNKTFDPDDMLSGWSITPSASGGCVPQLATVEGNQYMSDLVDTAGLVYHEGLSQWFMYHEGKPGTRPSGQLGWITTVMAAYTSDTDLSEPTWTRHTTPVAQATLAQEAGWIFATEGEQDIYRGGCSEASPVWEPDEGRVYLFTRGLTLDGGQFRWRLIRRTETLPSGPNSGDGLTFQDATMVFDPVAETGPGEPGYESGGAHHYRVKRDPQTGRYHLAYMHGIDNAEVGPLTTEHGIYHAYSDDQGATWTINTAQNPLISVSEMFTESAALGEPPVGSEASARTSIFGGPSFVLNPDDERVWLFWDASQSVRYTEPTYFYVAEGTRAAIGGSAEIMAMTGINAPTVNQTTPVTAISASATANAPAQINQTVIVPADNVGLVSVAEVVAGVNQTVTLGAVVGSLTSAVPESPGLLSSGVVPVMAIGATSAFVAPSSVDQTVGVSSAIGATSASPPPAQASQTASPGAISLTSGISAPSAIAQTVSVSAISATPLTHLLSVAASAGVSSMTAGILAPSVSGAMLAVTSIYEAMHNVVRSEVAVQFLAALPSVVIRWDNQTLTTWDAHVEVRDVRTDRISTGGSRIYRKHGLLRVTFQANPGVGVADMLARADTASAVMAWREFMGVRMLEPRISLNQTSPDGRATHVVRLEIPFYSDDVTVSDAAYSWTSDPNVQASHNAVRARFKRTVADELTLPVVYDNAPAPSSATSRWCRFVVNTGGTFVRTLGPDPDATTVGIATAQLFEHLGRGDGELLAIADRIAVRFREARESGVAFGTPSPVATTGRDEHYFQLNVQIPYRIEKRIT